jgi:HEAT repeat protein
MKPLTMLASLGLIAAATGYVWTEDKESVASLIRELKDSNPKVRVSAAEDIGHRGAVRASDVKKAIPALVDVLKKDKDPTVRRAVALALGQVDPDPALAVPALVAALKDKAPPVRIASATALGQLGDNAKDAIPALQQAQRDKDKALSRAAGMALRSIRGKK